jgi:acetyl-CoA acetyltransferase
MIHLKKSPSSTKTQVAVMGVGGSSLRSDRTEVSLQELIFEGTQNVLENAGITRSDLESVVLSASDLIDGRGIASMSSASAAGAYMKHETRTTNDGIYALALAALEIWSGRSRMSLVMCWNKMSEVRWEMATPAMFEPFYDRPVGMDDTIAQGLAANAARIKAEDFERAAAHAVSRNWRAVGRTGATGGGYRPAQTDGVYGMVLTDAETARASGRRFAILDSIAWGIGLPLTKRENPNRTGLADVAARAYREARITQLEQIDVIELTARWGYEEVSVLAEMLSPLGADAASLILNGETERDGAVPVNPSGGTAAPYLMQAAGLMAAGEVVLQLCGGAGRHQLNCIQRGVAHGQSGTAAQGNVVAVFSSDQGAI